LVLAIGIVVDDAIVVVEAVTAKMEKGLKPVEATIAAMKEVSGPIVATSLSLIAVFVPVAMMGGITGRLYQQFAITSYFLHQCLNPEPGTECIAVKTAVGTERQLADTVLQTV